VREQQERPLVGPLQVVEDEDERPLRGGGRDERADGLEEPVPLALRVAGRRGRGRELRPERREQPSQHARAGAGLLAELVRRRAADVVLERVHERLVRRQRLLERPAPEHARPAGVQRARELGDEAGLTDPRLAGHERDLPPAAERPPPRGLEPLALGDAPDERRPVSARLELGRQRRLRDVVQLPRHLDGGHGLGAARQLEQPRRPAARVRAGREGGGDAAREDPSRLGRARELPRPRGGAAARVAVRGRLAHLDPEAYVESLAGPAALPLAAALDPAGERERVGRAVELGQHAVAGSRELAPARRLDRRPDDVEVRAPRPVAPGFPEQRQRRRHLGRLRERVRDEPRHERLGAAGLTAAAERGHRNTATEIAEHPSRPPTSAR
jgi:hypothetical protein